MAANSPSRLCVLRHLEMAQYTRAAKYILKMASDCATGGFMAKNDKTVKVINEQGPMGFVLLMAYAGAAVYLVQQSNGFWGFIWALLKAVVWPAIVVYNVFEILKV